MTANIRGGPAEPEHPFIRECMLNGINLMGIEGRFLKRENSRILQGMCDQEG